MTFYLRLYSSIFLLRLILHPYPDPIHVGWGGDGGAVHEGAAHIAGNAFPVATGVVPQGEDIRVARHAQQSLSEGAEFVDNPVEGAQALDAGLTLDDKELVVHDEDYIQLVVVAMDVHALAGDDDIEGKVVRLEVFLHQIVGVLLKPAAREILQLTLAEDALRLGREMHLLEAL